MAQGGDSNAVVKLPYRSLDEFGQALTAGAASTTADDTSCIRLVDGPASSEQLLAAYERLTGRRVTTA
jgi:hypothetical protein